MTDLSRLLSELPRRSSQAIAGIQAPRHRGLRRHLLESLPGRPGSDGALLAEPVIEGAFPWLDAEPGEAARLLAGCHPAVRSALPGQPFAHQVEAWKALLGSEARSVMVTAGTGAGKTECFLLPMVEHLARLSEGRVELTGVRAVMLYPLNALINSQRERLTEWLSPFAGRIRFALYNGATPENIEAHKQNASPTELLSRKAIREAPPPILVTNPAMLEYMLVRSSDAPILDKSQGTLDFVILDEAHNYVGSQAAEMALLLRRVCLAFGRDPDEIRYVATSATIGDGEEADAQLRAFLSEVSGASPDRVLLVRGRRSPLDLPPASAREPAPLDAAELDAMTPDLSWDRLAPDRGLQSFLRDLHGRPQRWSRWERVGEELLGTRPTTAVAARLLEVAATAVDGRGRRLLPARVHLFHRSVTGLYACCNPGCVGRSSALADETWLFGAVGLDPHGSCPHCGWPVFELTFCSECGHEELECEEVVLQDGSSRLVRPLRSGVVDEFALEADRPDDDDGEEPATATRRRRFVGLEGVGGTFCDVEPGGTVADGPHPGTIRLRLFAADQESSHACRSCGTRPRGGTTGETTGRPFRVGAPFLLGSILPTVLGSVAPAETGAGPAPPSQGRRLLVFSDSRQGTARLAAKLQIDAERHYLRSFLYHRVQRRSPTADAATLDRLRAEIDQLRPISRDNPVITGLLKEKEALFAQLSSDAPKPVPWTELRDEIARDTRLQSQILQLWQDRHPNITAGRLAELMLLRELGRRPKSANSAETLGLVALALPPERIRSLAAPASWPLGLREWQDLLSILCTHFLRSRSIVALDPEFQRWVRWRPRFLKPVDQIHDSRKQVPLPSGRTRAGGRSSSLPSLIAQACGISLEDPSDADRVGEWIATAAGQLRTLQLLRQSGADGEVLHLEAFSLMAVRDAWLCPITRRVLDVTLKGLTPYPRGDKLHGSAEPIRFPLHPKPFPTPADRREIEAWMAECPEIRKLEELGAWGDLHSRAATDTEWVRAVEHSAQQPTALLKTYEADFKAGRINILSSSTTLEMGVDIGELEAVAMTNAPPSAANYRQRVGRAGRRGQPLAVGLTLCRDRPHDRAVFAEPIRPLLDRIRPPSVALGSEIIARRHVNAHLLGTWIRRTGTQTLKMQVGAFFGLPPEGAPTPENCPASAFAGWLDACEIRFAADPDLARGLERLVAGTPLSAESALVATVRSAFDVVRRAVEEEWAGIRSKIEAAGTDAAANAERNRLYRLLRSFVLGDLAERGFLPGYGFPRNIVPLVLTGVDDPGTRNPRGRDELVRGAESPTRDIDVALAEYAPGAEVVVDGLVYRSSGITLNWKRPADTEAVREIQALSSVWRCEACGAVGHSHADACTRCDALVQAVPVLTPAGFAVDVRDRPHDDPTTVAYVPPPEVWVSAAGVPWRPLPTPEVGAYRSTGAGSVTVLSAGPSQSGYAICLACGRAAAEHADGGGDPLADHRPLRSGGERCPGNDQPFAIRRRHRLGRKYSTDVFELRLSGCRSRRTALSIAVALREALAETLGIEADEMGVEAVQTRTDEGATTWSAVLLDRADGGAGFASAAATGHGAEMDLRGLLRKAAAYLDCRNGCDSVCEACLLSASTQHIVAELDRRAALELMRGIVLPGLELDPALAVFGPETVPELAPLPAAVGRALAVSTDRVADVWLLGDPADWDLRNWAVPRLARQWRPRGGTVRLHIAEELLRDLAPDAKLDLGLLVDRIDAELHVTTAVRPAERMVLAARVGGIAWASAPDAAMPGPDWGEGAVVRGPMGAAPAIGRKVGRDELFRLPPPVSLVQIRSELDGGIGGFAQRVRSLLDAVGVGDLLGTTPESIAYADRYLISPLAVRLATGLVDAFSPSASTDVRIVTGRGRQRPVDGSPSRVQHDWRGDGERAAVVSAWWKASGREHWRWEVSENLPHARRLVVAYGGGCRLVLTLDQGIGFLDPAMPIDFPFFADALGQARSMGRDFLLRAKIYPREPSTFWTVSRH
jgi:DEAD/DEAH box helicase domain-containing protein